MNKHTFDMLNTYCVAFSFLSAVLEYLLKTKAISVGNDHVLKLLLKYLMVERVQTDGNCIKFSLILQMNDRPSNAD